MYKRIGRLYLGIFRNHDIQIGFSAGYDAWAHEIGITVDLPFLRVIATLMLDKEVDTEGGTGCEKE